VDAAHGPALARETPLHLTNLSCFRHARLIWVYPALELLKNQRGRSTCRRPPTKQKSASRRSCQSPLDPGTTAWFIHLNYNSGGAGHIGKPPARTYPKLKISAAPHTSSRFGCCVPVFCRVPLLAQDPSGFSALQSGYHNRISSNSLPSLIFSTGFK